MAEEVIEIGSGLNGDPSQAQDKKLLKLLADPAITVIVVEHRDRLARFGVELIVAAMEASKRHVVVMNETEYEDWFTDVNTVDDIMQDLTDDLSKK